MIGVSTQGRFEKTTRFLQKMNNRNLFSDMNRYGEMGVQALARATPKESAETANGWRYRVMNDRKGPRIEWYNVHADDNNNTSVAVLIQYGHGTGTGGYVQGRDFINPTMRPIFDQIANDLWRKVKS